MSIGLNLITSNTASKLVQDSAFQVLSEGSLKAVARPVFTLMDDSASPEARKYSATKEFIFQSEVWQCILLLLQQYSKEVATNY